MTSLQNVNGDYLPNDIVSSFNGTSVPTFDTDLDYPNYGGMVRARMSKRRNCKKARSQ